MNKLKIKLVICITVLACNSYAKNDNPIEVGMVFKFSKEVLTTNVKPASSLAYTEDIEEAEIDGLRFIDGEPGAISYAFAQKDSFSKACSLQESILSEMIDRPLTIIDIKTYDSGYLGITLEATNDKTGEREQIISILCSHGKFNFFKSSTTVENFKLNNLLYQFGSYLEVVDKSDLKTFRTNTEIVDIKRNSSISKSQNSHTKSDKREKTSVTQE
jgi:hypothetical protein